MSCCLHQLSTWISKINSVLSCHLKYQYLLSRFTFNCSFTSCQIHPQSSAASSHFLPNMPCHLQTGVVWRSALYHFQTCTYILHFVFHYHHTSKNHGDRAHPCLTPILTPKLIYLLINAKAVAEWIKWWAWGLCMNLNSTSATLLCVICWVA